VKKEVFHARKMIGVRRRSNILSYFQEFQEEGDQRLAGFQNLSYVSRTR